MVINGKNFTPKYSLRSMFVMEEMTGKAFSIDTLLDTYCFCYACLVSNPDNPGLDFTEFIDACDQDPSIIEEFNEFMSAELKRREVIQKKKVTKRETRS